MDRKYILVPNAIAVKKSYVNFLPQDKSPNQELTDIFSQNRITVQKRNMKRKELLQKDYDHILSPRFHYFHPNVVLIIILVITKNINSK